jgi:hypothetical protein
MNRPLLPRLGAACGVVFPIAMFLAVGNGNSFAPWRAVVATWALVLGLRRSDRRSVPWPIGLEGALRARWSG